MELNRLNKDFVVCKIQDYNDIDLNNDFVFMTKTDEGISLVCEACRIPQNAISVENGWKALKTLRNEDFEISGGIAKITNIISHTNVNIFLITTYSAVYIFLKSIDFDKCITSLKNNDCIID